MLYFDQSLAAQGSYLVYMQFNFALFYQKFYMIHMDVNSGVIGHLTEGLQNNSFFRGLLDRV